MFNIAQFFRVRPITLIMANPHIENPDVIYPGDILCIPGLVPYPCCLVLQPREEVPTGTSASALLHVEFRGGQAVSVVAALPPPETWGEFDLYLAEVLINPEVGGFGNQLFPTPEDPPTWSTTINLPTVVEVAPESFVVLRPANSESGISGPAILQGSMRDCFDSATCADSREEQLATKARTGIRRRLRRRRRNRKPRR